MLNDERIIKEAYKRKIQIERFPSLTSDNIISILNKMNNDEIYFWVYVQRDYKLISKIIKQLMPEDKLLEIFNEKNKGVNHDYYKNHLLLRMLEVDNEEGLLDEVNIIL